MYYTTGITSSCKVIRGQNEMADKMNIQIIKTMSPSIVHFSSIGSSELGYITVAQHPEIIPFVIKRVYWTYFTPHNVERGHHAHKALHQVIIAVSGNIKVKIEGFDGTRNDFVLDTPDKGLYLPPMHWRTIHFSHNAVLLCMASEKYDADDYIREYDEFKNLSRTYKAGL